MGGHHAQIARIIAAGPLPPSYGGDKALAAFNLLLMLASTYLAAAMWLSEIRDLWRYRKVDRWNHPITSTRALVLFASLAAFIRSGAEAANLMGWDPRDPSTGVVVLILKHYFDPVATACLFGWLSVRMTSKRAVNAQLRKNPQPTRLWATLPQLTRPFLVVVLCAIMALASVYLRGR